MGGQPDEQSFSEHDGGPGRMLRPWDAAVKAAFDRVASAGLLVLLAPVLASCALVVKSSSPRRSVIEASPRLDRNGRVFGLLNFREPAGSLLSSAFERFGLRHLPELVNVMRGEMSLVGPRPRLVQNGPVRRLNVRPGMTGLWVLDPRSERTPHEVADSDREYAATWSLKTDIGIILESAAAVGYGRKSD